MNINLDHEIPKWRAEFGDSTAMALKRKVLEEMPHYEYLKHFRLPVRPTSSRKSFNSNRSPMLDTLSRNRSAVNLAEAEKGDHGFGSPLRVIQTSLENNRRNSDIWSPGEESYAGGGGFGELTVR